VQIERSAALILIRSALIAVHHANQTGNYSVLYALSAPDFQKANTPEKLAQSFSKLRAKNFDLSGILVLDPQLTVQPEIFSNGVMRMVGFFPSVPMQVVFELQFIPVAGQWRLVALAVDVVGSTPVAPRDATPNPALASSYTPTPTPAAKAKPSASAAADESTPTATPTPKGIGAVEVRPTSRTKGTPKPKSQISNPRD
jgi:hypothetical protein